MKIFVTFAGELSDAKLKAFSDGITSIKKQGHNVTISSTSSSKGKKIDKIVRDTDIVITESSSVDLKVGFDIAKALDEKKIVIALEDESSKADDFKYIESNKYKNLIHAKYNKENIQSVIEKSLDKAKKMLDTKFILIISPEIDRYLDWASQTKRMHKAQIVRNSIESIMKKDRDYKNYLGE